MILIKLGVGLMIVSELKLYDFRCFGSVKCGELGFSVTFHQGLNALIGENDSGKTAIIDALKLVLHTKSDYVRPTIDDFYIDENGESRNEFRIECTISDFSDNEAKNFIEYLDVKREGDKNHYYLNLFYRAFKENNRVFQELKVGSRDEGISLNPKARALLETVYLKPLRDAESDMSSGRNSRLSQILIKHRVFNTIDCNGQHPLKEFVNTANAGIEKYFSEGEGHEILEIIRGNLEEFHDLHSLNVKGASIKVDDINLKTILESLSIDLYEVCPGLGELNLLFIAVELILLKNDQFGGLKLALVEELEAHLHPQAQLRLISYLQKEYNENGAQVIISTHSPILASKINLKNIVLIKDRRGFSLSQEHTAMSAGDYLFLQRFLDATKSNMFFAKGIIMVEGDAENLLVPVIAEILDYSLEKYGVSIVNVGSTAFLRYSNIFKRKDGTTIGIPISVVTDCDVKPYSNGNNAEKEFVDKTKEIQNQIKKKEGRYSCGSIKTFVSTEWTLEYCLALSCLKDYFHLAINIAKKIKNSDNYVLTSDMIKEAAEVTEAERKKFCQLHEKECAYRVFSLMLKEDGSSGLKAIAAQCLSAILRYGYDIGDIALELMFDSELFKSRIDEEKRRELKKKIENDLYLSYLVKAIKHASGIDVSNSGVVSDEDY